MELRARVCSRWRAWVAGAETKWTVGGVGSVAKGLEQGSRLERRWHKNEIVETQHLDIFVWVAPLNALPVTNLM